jgi:hypothetical protein
MTKLGRRAVQVGVLLGAIVGLIGCTEQMNADADQGSSAVVSENGLSFNGLSFNGLSFNGLSFNGLSFNGLSFNGLSFNGLATTGGLSTTSGMMTTPGGRDVVKYMVKCAFPSGHTLNTKDQYNNPYSYPGSLGVAPEFETGLCDVTCQERVSACLLAHVNNSGAHIELWLDSESNIGWGQSTDYPYQEGSFFGNLFTANTWSGYYCLGKDWDVGSVPGRLGQPLATNVYVDPYGGNVGCAASYKCSAHSNGDGFDNCTTYDGYKWNHVVTVWRNFDANTIYKICSYGTNNSCLGVTSASTADSASIEIRSYTGAPGQTWWLLQVSPGKYKIINANSGKAIDQDTSSPPHLIQKGYSGATTQQMVVQSLGGTASQFGRYSMIPSSGTTGYDVPQTADGTKVQLDSNLTSDVAKWTITPVGTLASSQGSGSGGTNPCASYCTNPTTMSAQSSQISNLSTSAVCYQTTYPIGSGNCGNMSGRTFTINGDAVSCNGNFPSLPPKVNGGYCFQATAGGSTGGWFGTW